MDNSSVGVVVPTLNEAKNIAEVICRLRIAGYSNILVIDGQSTDNTIEVAAKHGAKVALQKGRGKGNAIRQVLNDEYFDSDVLVLMDADGSMSPQEIPIFLEALSLGADVVKGSRFLKGGYTDDMSPLRRFGNKLMVMAVNLLWSADYTDLCYGFAAFSKRSIQLLSPFLESKNFEIETEIFIRALQLGLVVREVPSREQKRRNGKSNLNAFRDGFKIFGTIAKHAFRSQ